MPRETEARRAGNFGEEQLGGREVGSESLYETCTTHQYTPARGSRAERDTSPVDEAGAVHESRFLVQLDPTPHASKPVGAEIGAITRRLQQAGPMLVTFGELRDAILAGATWCGGCFEACVGSWGPFVSQQLFALDVDNDASYVRRDGTRGKRPLLPDEDGYLDPIEALDRCKELGLAPMMLYFTHSATVDPWWPRYRLVFDVGEPVVEEARAREVLGKLLSIYPEADQACSNLNRLFFGGQEVVDCRGGRWVP